jgi:hypothetical protein|tara:strand:- start:171 stop:374 length:204 start_codon:yes stop_codon:yes gene_type:complete
MLYKVYNNSQELQGEFSSISEMELHMDSVRNCRGERYQQLPRHSCFDYIKSIGWFWEVVDNNSPNSS